jgi:hypothetical protein
MQPTWLRVLQWRPSHGSEGGPPSSDVCLRGGERGADPTLRATCPIVSALPWSTSASRVEIGSPDGSGDSWWSVRPGDGGATPGGSGDEGHRQVCSTWNLWCIAHGSDDPGRWAGDDGGPTPLSIGSEWARSTIDGGIQRR